MRMRPSGTGEGGRRPRGGDRGDDREDDRVEREERNPDDGGEMPGVDVLAEGNQLSEGGGFAERGEQNREPSRRRRYVGSRRFSDLFGCSPYRGLHAYATRVWALSGVQGFRPLPLFIESLYDAPLL